MFYFFWSRGYNTYKWILYIFNAVFSVVGLMMLGLSVYLTGSHWRLLLPPRIVDFVTVCSVLQILINVCGIFGTRKVDDAHEHRGRNYLLAAYTLLLLMLAIAQAVEVAYVFDGVKELDLCNRDVTQPCPSVGVEAYAHKYPDEWRQYQKDNMCCGFDAGDDLARDPVLNSSCPRPANVTSSKLFSIHELSLTTTRDGDASRNPLASEAPALDTSFGAASPVPGCRHTIVTYILLFIVIINVMAFLIISIQVVSLFSAVCLCCCKFRHHTVEGFETSGIPYQRIGVSSSICL